MSKQQSLTPDEQQVMQRALRSSATIVAKGGRKAKPWVLWAKSVRPYPSWMKEPKKWWRAGRYRTRKVAVEAKRAQSRGFTGHALFEYRIRHEDEGPPT